MFFVVIFVVIVIIIIITFMFVFTIFISILFCFYYSYYLLLLFLLMLQISLSLTLLSLLLLLITLFLCQFTSFLLLYSYCYNCFVTVIVKAIVFNTLLWLLILIVLNFNVFHLSDVYTVLYRKKFKNSFVQITGEGNMPKNLKSVFSFDFLYIYVYIYLYIFRFG